MPHVTIGLPTSFADQFFRHATAKDEAEAPTPGSVDAEIAALEQQLVEKRKPARGAPGRGGARGQRGGEQAAKQAVITELQKVVADSEQQAAEARARLAELLG
jgi:hypothetical protein